MKYYFHPTAVIDEGANLGEGCKVWHFCHIMAGARLGKNCNLGQNVFVASGVQLGNGVKVQITYRCIRALFVKTMCL